MLAHRSVYSTVHRAGGYMEACEVRDENGFVRKSGDLGSRGVNRGFCSASGDWDGFDGLEMDVKMGSFGGRHGGMEGFEI
jgi:hypothetical protein